MNVIFRKLVCSIVVSAFTITSTGINWAFAKDDKWETKLSPSTEIRLENRGAYGKGAQNFGRELGDKAKNSAPKGDATNFSVQAGGQDYSFSKESFAPSPQSKVRYKYSSQDFENQKLLHDNPEQMDLVGEKQKDSLFEESKLDSPTIEGDVYAILTDLAGKNRADYSAADFLKKTQEIMADLENVLKDIATCDANSAIDQNKKYIKIPEIKRCEQVMDKSQDCVISNNWEAEIIRHSGGKMNIDSCGDFCIKTWIGRVGDNYWAGWCDIYEDYTSIQVVNPDAITYAVLHRVKWDDYIKIHLGNSRDNDTLIYTGPYWWKDNPNYFPPETPGDCELSTSWETYPNIDLTNIFKNIKKDNIINFLTRVSVAGNGEGFAEVHIYYDPAKALQGNEWTPNSCIESALMVQDGAAKGSVTCVNQPPIDENGCVKAGLVGICPEMMAPSPLEGISPFCRRVEVHAKSVIDTGELDVQELMYYDEEGKPKYISVELANQMGGIAYDGCEQYEKDPNCTFISSECDEEYRGKSGTCYANQVFYECGSSVEVESPIMETTYDCKGLGCIGEECVDYSRTYSTDFGRVSALLNALQHIGQDMQCDGLDDDGKPIGDRNVECFVFKGKRMECARRKAAWVKNDCCDPEGLTAPNFSDYISMLLAQQRAHSATMFLGEMNIALMAAGGTVPAAAQVAGSYASFVSSAEITLAHNTEVITNAFSSVMDNITSFGHKYITAPFEQLKQWVMEKIKEMVEKIVGKLVESLGYDTAAATTAGATASHMMSMAFAYVAWIYAAYQIANLVFSMMAKCRDPEFETALAIKEKRCTETGQYCASKGAFGCAARARVHCCYQSPLARIINEQIRYTQPQILGQTRAQPWGPDNIHPDCRGVPLEAVDKINWDLINLDEWIAILKMTGNWSADQARLNLSTLTGANSRMNFVKNSGFPQDDPNLAVRSNQEIVVKDYYELKGGGESKVGGSSTMIDPNKPNPASSGGGTPSMASMGSIADRTMPSLASSGLSASSSLTAKGKTPSMASMTADKPAMASAGSKGNTPSLASSSDRNSEQRAYQSLTGGKHKLDTSKNPGKNRYDTIQRTEDKLKGFPIDELRVEASKCITLNLGMGVTARGGCGEFENRDLICRHMGDLFDCMEIAYQNSLYELLHEGQRPSAAYWWNQGYRCYQFNQHVDCSTLYDEEQYVRALEEYARRIGGTTYLNRYICMDKSNTYSAAICERAMLQNYCECLPGKFMCQDGWKPIACGNLGKTKNECTCLIGACDDECNYGGWHATMGEETSHVCRETNCVYGKWIDDAGINNCTTAVCPYGVK